MSRLWREAGGGPGGWPPAWAQLEPEGPGPGEGRSNGEQEEQGLSYAESSVQAAAPIQLLCCEYLGRVP